MARCARKTCDRWRPDTLVRRAHLGVTFNDRWFCSPRCLEAETQSLLGELRHHDAWLTPPAPPVGKLLVERRGLDPSALRAALDAQRASGRRLGAELIEMGVVSREDVLRALAAQAGVGCLLTLDATRVAPGPGGLARETVEALRVVPFDTLPAQQRLLVACGSPLPRSALTALREMTGCRVEPFLVPDTVLDQLIDAYGRGDPARTGGVGVRSVPDAAASIVRAAVLGSARRMHPVRCDPYVWVRLEGETPEDLMVTLEPPRKETTWQVAPTPH